MPPLPPPPPRFYAEQTSYGMEYPFGQFGSAVLDLSPPKILPTPSLLVRGGNAGETALMLWEHCSAVAKTLVCYQHLSSYQYRAQHYEGCYGEN